MDFLNQFVNAFIPLFVAMDVVAVLPLFIAITKGLPENKRRIVIADALMGAFALSMLFLATGQLIFRFVGITPDDFRIGGGIVLLILAVSDLLFSEILQAARSKSGTGNLGVVPIGIPLIVGPAALTSILISVTTYGYIITLVALLANLAIVWLVFWNSRLVFRVIGEDGARAFGKVASLFLAGIAVMMIRVGITHFIFNHK